MPSVPPAALQAAGFTPVSPAPGMAPEPSQCALLSAVCEPRLQHQAPRGPRSHPRRVPMRLCRRSWGSFGKGTVVPEGHPQAPTLALGQGGIGLQCTSESRQELAQGAGPAEEAAGGPHLGSRPRPAVGPRGPPAASGGTGYRCQGPCPPGRGRRLPPPHTCRLLETPRPL